MAPSISQQQGQGWLYTNIVEGHTTADGTLVLLDDSDCAIRWSEVNDMNLCLRLQDLRPGGRPGTSGHAHGAVELKKVFISSYESPDSSRLLRDIGVHDGNGCVCVPTLLSLFPQAAVFGCEEEGMELREILEHENNEGHLRVVYPGSWESNVPGVEGRNRYGPTYTGNHAKVLLFHFTIRDTRYEASGRQESRRKQEFVRLVITSANLTEKNWDLYNEVLWVRDIPLRDDPDLFGCLKHSFARSFLKAITRMLPHSETQWYDVLWRANWDQAIGRFERCVISVTGSQPLYRGSFQHLDGAGACGTATSRSGCTRDLSAIRQQDWVCWVAEASSSFSLAQSDYMMRLRTLDLSVDAEELGASAERHQDDVVHVRLGVNEEMHRDATGFELLSCHLEPGKNLLHQINHTRPEVAFCTWYPLGNVFTEYILAFTRDEISSLSTRAGIALLGLLWVPSGMENLLYPALCGKADACVLAVTGAKQRNYREKYGFRVRVTEQELDGVGAADRGKDDTRQSSAHYYPSAKGGGRFIDHHGNELLMKRNSPAAYWQTAFQHEDGQRCVPPDWQWFYSAREKEWFSLSAVAPPSNIKPGIKTEDTVGRVVLVAEYWRSSADPNKKKNCSLDVIPSTQDFYSDWEDVFQRRNVVGAGDADALPVPVTLLLSEHCKYDLKNIKFGPKDLPTSAYAPAPTLIGREKVRAHQKIIFRETLDGDGFVYLGSHNLTHHDWGVMVKPLGEEHDDRAGTRACCRDRQMQAAQAWIVVDNTEMGVAIRFGADASIAREAFSSSAEVQKDSFAKVTLYLRPPAPTRSEICARLPFICTNRMKRDEAAGAIKIEASGG